MKKLQKSDKRLKNELKNNKNNIFFLFQNQHLQHEYNYKSSVHAHFSSKNKEH